MPEFGIKDAIDILIVAVLLYYIFRQMKESGTINIFYGVMAFIAVWAVAGEVFELRLTGSILDQFVSIGLLVLVIIFQDQIKRFLIELGSHRRWRFCTGSSITAMTMMLSAFAPKSCLSYMRAWPCQRPKPGH